MRKNVFYTLISFILVMNMTNIGHAFDLDETVDDEIRKNYNPNKLIQDVGIDNTALNKKLKSTPKTPEETLPALPNITKQPQNNKTKSDVSGNNIVVKTPPKVYTSGNIKINKGTKLNVVNTSAISDWQIKGTQIKFVNNTPIHLKRCTIPQSTVFNGEIVDSHRPQITCNGGLVAIKVHSMIYKGQTIPINAYIIRADDKKIFFNNIKGDRTYLKTMWKKGNWGRTLFNKMMTLTVSLGASGSTLVLSPFPLAYGTICLGANTILSPITAFFAKGGSVSIPAQSKFRIKLLDDVMVD